MFILKCMYKWGMRLRNTVHRSVADPGISDRRGRAVVRDCSNGGPLDPPPPPHTHTICWILTKNNYKFLCFWYYIISSQMYLRWGGGGGWRWIPPPLPPPRDSFIALNIWLWPSPVMYMYCHLILTVHKLISHLFLF